MRFLKFLSFLILCPTVVHANTAQLPMSTLQVLFAKHEIELQYPTALLFNAKGQHILTHAGTHEKKLGAVEFNALQTNSEQTPVSQLKITDIHSLVPAVSAHASQNLSIILFTIDESLCSACASEKEALKQLDQNKNYQTFQIDVLFR